MDDCRAYSEKRVVRVFASHPISVQEEEPASIGRFNTAPGAGVNRIPIRIQVTKQLVGTVIAADENGKTEKRAEGLRGVNPNSLVTWELPLPPGMEKTITYRYQIYVRN